MGFLSDKDFLIAAFNAFVAVLTLSLGWFFGQRLTYYWTIRQKKRELELALVNEVYKLYGEFFSIWKLWNYYLTQNDFRKETKWELLERASAAEAGIEAVFVRLSSERKLKEDEIGCLGKFRQAYQALRECIKAHKKLDWDYSEHHEYVAFKTGATKLAWIINRGDRNLDLPTSDDAVYALRRITSNEWENKPPLT